MSVRLDIFYIITKSILMYAIIETKIISVRLQIAPIVENCENIVLGIQM